MQITSGISRIMKECWAHNPSARLSAFRIKKSLLKLTEKWVQQEADDNFIEICIMEMIFFFLIVYKKVYNIQNLALAHSYVYIMYYLWKSVKVKTNEQDGKKIIMSSSYFKLIHSWYWSNYLSQINIHLHDFRKPSQTRDLYWHFLAKELFSQNQSSKLRHGFHHRWTKGYFRWLRETWRSLTVQIFLLPL